MIFDSLQSWLTRQYLNFGGEFLYKETYSAHDVEADVYWFSEDVSRAGQATIFNTITLNQYHLSEVSENVSDYVFLHEFGHVRVPLPLRAIFYMLALPLGAFAVATIVSVPFIPLSVFIDTGSIPSTAIASVGAAIVLIIGVLPFALVVRLDEINAELFAIGHIGEEQYLAANDELRKYRSGRHFARVLRFVLYPSPRFILWLSRKLMDH